VQRCTRSWGYPRIAGADIAELRGGWRAGGEGPRRSAQGRRVASPGRCHEPDGNRWRRRRQWRRAGQVRACTPSSTPRRERSGAARSAADARPVRTARGLGKWDDRRDEELDQAEQRERHDRRPRSRADRPAVRSVRRWSDSLIGTTTYGPSTAGTSEVLRFWCRTPRQDDKRR
jgi:hypothetical protein